MPQFLVACLSAAQPPLIIRWSVEADRHFGTKPSGKWGATILIASSNGPFSMFFCRPSLPPAALAARLSFTTKAANIQFTLPGRLPRPSARRRAGPDSSPMQARNRVIPSSISTISSRAASLSSSSRSARACLAARNASIARETALFCFATTRARRSASNVHMSDTRLLTCDRTQHAWSASCRSTSAPSSASATSSHRCPSTIARCSAAPTSSHRRLTRSSGASWSPLSVGVTPSHRHHRRSKAGSAGQAHRRWKMCDGWPAGPAPSSFYSTLIGTDPDPYPHCWCPSPPATRRRLLRWPRPTRLG
jgi:hypothetical protein